MIDAAQLFAALTATWPPAHISHCGPFELRDGQGGGKRVSATALMGAFDPVALDQVETQMGAHRLFHVRSDQPEFAAELDARGYAIRDETLLYSCAIDTIAEPPRPVSLLNTWPPLAIQLQIWADGEVGPARIAVMERAQTPKTAFIARFQNRAAGVGFVSIHAGIAMMHALHTEPDFRRQGVARYMVRGMADWARTQGASQFALAVTKANTPARALYETLGMTEAARYHYREKTA